MDFYYFLLDKWKIMPYNKNMKPNKNRKLPKNLFYKYIDNDIFDEFHIIAVGKEKCSADKKQEGPFVKNRFILHLCLKGKGYYNLDGKMYTVQAGDIFYIPANHVIYYYPDKQDPWEYFWFEYNGQNALKLNDRAGFSKDSPIYRTKAHPELSRILSDMIDRLNDKTDDLEVISGIYRFFSVLILERMPQKAAYANAKDELIRKIFAYISANYSNTTLSLSDIAAHFNLNASYLSRFFKDTTGVPLSKYIIDFRMQKAVALLKRKDLSVKSIAISVGYSDPLYFSREFSRHFHNAPTSNRKELENKELEN